MPKNTQIAFFLTLYLRILEMSKLIFAALEEVLASVGAQLLGSPAISVQLCYLSAGKQSQWH